MPKPNCAEKTIVGAGSCIGLLVGGVTTILVNAPIFTHKACLYAIDLAKNTTGCFNVDCRYLFNSTVEKVGDYQLVFNCSSLDVAHQLYNATQIYDQQNRSAAQWMVPTVMSASAVGAAAMVSGGIIYLRYQYPAYKSRAQIARAAEVAASSSEAKASPVIEQTPLRQEPRENFCSKTMNWICCSIWKQAADTQTNKASQYHSLEERSVSLDELKETSGVSSYQQG